jgi:GH15 family glucan-1,4-alpha-glucosidase
MTSETTGAVIAAPTTSLPEDLGGVRNWDFRCCWLRDAVPRSRRCSTPDTPTRHSAFRDFLVRVGTGDPTTTQIMYGIGGERRLTEFELPELPGYEASRPVRGGNAAPSSSSSTCAARSSG